MATGSSRRNEAIIRNRLIFAALTISCVASIALAAAPLPVPSPAPEALAYHRGQNLFWLADQALSLLLPIVILATGWSAGLAGWAERVTHGRWYPALLLYSFLYLLITFLVNFPLSYAHSFVFAHAYDQSNQSFGKWARNETILLANRLIFAALTIWVPFWLIRRRPKSWWLWGTGAVAPILILGMVIFPVWVLPLFTTFTPLPPSPLRTAIEAEAARASLTNPTILLMDRSSDSKTFDAYVAGLGGTTRIVIFDTTLTTLTEPETLFLIGHEIKHYLMHDVWKLTGIFIGVAFIGFFTTDRLARLATRRWGPKLGFSNIGEPAALPLLWVSLELVILAVTPLVDAATRHIEHEADRFGLEMTHGNQAAASMFIKHQNEALGVPYPGWLERTFRQNHPSLGDRITFANEYHPWEDGKPLVYGDRIKPVE